MITGLYKGVAMRIFAKLQHFSKAHVSTCTMAMRVPL